MKKVLVTLLLLGIVGAGGFGIYHHFFEQKEEEVSTKRLSSNSEDAVFVDLVSDITEFVGTSGYIEKFGGQVEPQATLEVKLENDRKVKECFVKEGDEVKEGQRLFIYDTREDEDKLERDKIEIERAKSNIELTQKQIEQLEKEKAKANADDQLSYTTQILTSQNEIKQAEYDIKSYETEIKQLEETVKNAVVTAEMAGVIKSVNSESGSDSYSYYGSSESAYITILALGDYRIKGTINEQNYNSVYIDQPMIAYSRVDNTIQWKGVVSDIKTSSDENESNNSYSFYGSDESGSSNYTFYVQLENSEGLLLGQHVYLQEDTGVNGTRSGLWIDELYIVQEDGHAYVWLAGKNNLIEKKEIKLGDYDESIYSYEILEGLTANDYIAYPMEGVAEGVPVIYNDYTIDYEDDGENIAYDDDDMEGWDDIEFDEKDLEDWYSDDSGEISFDDADWDDEEYDEEDFDEDAGSNDGFVSLQ